MTLSLFQSNKDITTLDLEYNACLVVKCAFINPVIKPLSFFYELDSIRLHRMKKNSVNFTSFVFHGH